jgi:hypothetical protein
MKEKYLPIGTVCILKGGTKRLMITGFCAVPKENKQEIYDYSGCIFPEGFLVSNQTCLFNHDQIEKIYHMGLCDEAHIKFNETLTRIIEKKEEKNIFANKIVEL